METVRTGEKLNWDAKVIEGKLVIKPIEVITKHPDGRQDVLLKLPSLALIKEFKEANNIQ
jgi:hypothetical protein